MITVDVDLGERAYPIHIGTGLLSQAELFAPHIRGTRAVIVTNETVAPLYAARVEAAIRSLGKTVDMVVLPDGESFKTWETLNRSSMHSWPRALTARPPSWRSAEG